MEKAQEELYVRQRRHMVTSQLLSRDIRDAEVLAAMRTVPRHLFMPEEQRVCAYEDGPLAIGYEQTISQPYIVAFMTQSLRLTGIETVLEIGTGSGYQAAVLAEVAAQVYTIEIVAALAQRAQETLRRLGYHNIEVRCGDGYQGWAEHAPFDAIIVTCAPKQIPPPLKQQLKVGGIMIIPVGEINRGQELIYLEKRADQQLAETNVFSVRFVPMTGQAEKI